MAGRRQEVAALREHLAPDSPYRAVVLLGEAGVGKSRLVTEISALDEFLLEEDREGERRKKIAAARDEPSLESFLPTRGEGLGLSASDIEVIKATQGPMAVRSDAYVPAAEKLGVPVTEVLTRLASLQERGRRVGRVRLESL